MRAFGGASRTGRGASLRNAWPAGPSKIGGETDPRITEAAETGPGPGPGPLRGRSSEAPKLNVGGLFSFAREGIRDAQFVPARIRWAIRVY